MLHDIKSSDRKYSQPRVGRGGKRGTTSGKGTKGQKARSGRVIRPAERDYIQRLPKLRGATNFDSSKSFRPEIINVGELEKRLGEGSIANFQTLGKTKLLGCGEIKKAITVEGLAVSASAKKKIESAGGKVIAAEAKAVPKS